MTDFPSSIFIPRTKENRTGVVYDSAKEQVIFVEDIEQIEDEVIALENDCGSSPVVNNIFNFKTFFESIADLNQTVTGSSAISGLPGLRILTADGDADSYARLEFDNGLIFRVFDFAKNFKTFFNLSFIYNTSQNAIFGIGDIEKTGLFFKVVNGSLYATVIYPTEDFEEILTYSVEITGITLTNFYVYKIEYTAYTTAKFYINGVLKTTIDLTSYFRFISPSEMEIGASFEIKNTVSNSERYMVIKCLAHQQKLT